MDFIGAPGERGEGIREKARKTGNGKREMRDEKQYQGKYISERTNRQRRVRVALD